MRRRQREPKRRVATTVLARMMGSAPKAGSSSTTKLVKVKLGTGRRLRVTWSKWTGRPRLLLMLVGDAVLVAVDADERREDGEQNERRGRWWRGRPSVGEMWRLLVRGFSRVEAGAECTSMEAVPVESGTRGKAAYLIRWRVRLQRVLSKMWMRMWPMKLMRSPMLCLSIWSAGVWKDQ